MHHFTCASVCRNGNWKTGISPLENIKHTTQLLVRDVIDHMTLNTCTARTEHSATLLRVVDHLSSRHEIVFESVTRRLRLDRTPDVNLCRQTFVGVGEELFADGQFNWGRAVTVFAFAGWLAKSCCKASTSPSNGHFNRPMKNGDTQKCLEAIAQSAGSYMAEKLSDWIAHEGGWVSMCHDIIHVINFAAVQNFRYVVFSFLCEIWLYVLC